MCLPPVGHTHHSPLNIEERTNISEALNLNESLAALGEQSKSAKSTRSRKLMDNAECLSRLSHTLASVKENSSVNSIKEPSFDVKEKEMESQKESSPTEKVIDKCVSKPEENISKTETEKQIDKPLVESKTEEASLPSSCSSATKKDSLSESLKETAKSSASSKTKQLLKNDLTIENIKEVLGRPNTSSRDIMLESLQETLGRPPTTTSRYKGLERRKEFTLESLSSSEARAMSGLHWKKLVLLE